MPTKDAAQAIETISIPEAGRRYFGIGPNASYGAAARGEIPFIKVGRLKRVPIRLMENRMLNPDKVERES
jgi:hypothetical protein